MKVKIIFAILTAAVLVFGAACSKEEPPVDPIISGEDIIITPTEPSSESEPSDIGEPTAPYEPSESSEPETSSEPAPSTPTSSAQSESSASSETSEETKPGELKDYGTLILVNPTHYIPEDYKIELEKVQGKYNMDIKAASAAKEFVAAAKAAGFNMQLCSAYRTVEKSAELYAKQVKKFLNAGYGQAEAEKEAARWVAPPGTSEHHTGLAMDLVSSDYWGYYSDLEHEYENFDSFKWMYAHCAEYGFILRYPKDKQDVTGITYEPWHYRYVGVEAAKYIMENGLCLEEYLEIYS